MSVTRGATQGRRELSGRLSDVVTLEGRVRTRDTQGGFSEAYERLDPGRVHAEVLSAAAQERVAAAGTEAEYTHRVTIRWHPGVTEHARILWRGRVLEVVSPPIEIGRRWAMELLCRERGAEEAIDA